LGGTCGTESRPNSASSYSGILAAPAQHIARSESTAERLAAARFRAAQAEILPASEEVSESGIIPFHALLRKKQVQKKSRRP